MFPSVFIKKYYVIVFFSFLSVDGWAKYNKTKFLSEEEHFHKNKM
jgi:hypothetical protein